MRRRALMAGGILCGMAAGTAAAAEIDTGIPDFKLRFDNTVKYTAMGRVDGQSARLMNRSPFTQGFDDGDRNFKRGLISNRVDLLSELEASYGNFGLRLSGASWYDTVYNHGTANDSPATSNNYTVSNRAFTDGTARMMGRNAELLDAFVSGRGEVGAMPLSVRVGRFAQQWGESLFFGANGVAGAMAPVDVSKLTAVPNSTFRETIRPVGQISANLQVDPDLSVGAYWQFEHGYNRLPAAGSYFSTSDNLPDGGESILVTTIGGTKNILTRAGDVKPDGLKQFGGQVKFRVADLEPEFGVYALLFDGKSAATTYSSPVIPSPIANLAASLRQAGQFRWAFPEQTQLYGVSANHSIDTVNIGLELSIRRNAALASFPQALSASDFASASSGNAKYAVGDTIHANLSAIWDIGRNPFSEEATLMSEVAFNGRMRTTANAGALDPNASRYAVASRTLLTFQYRQVMPGLDVRVPIGISYSPAGRSSALSSGFAVDKGGDISIGVAGTYDGVWNFSLGYTHYYGRADSFLNGVAGQNYQTFGQALADRDFVALSLNRSF